MSQTEVVIYNQYPRYELRYVPNFVSHGHTGAMNMDFGQDDLDKFNKDGQMDHSALLVNDIPMDCGDSTVHYDPTYHDENTDSKLSEAETCTVCGDKATKYRYSHYGTTSCFSCRAFYRRTLKKSSHELFYCTTGNCMITVNTRKKCQYCRFKKCKAVGMTYRDPENILPDSNGVVPIPKELFEARQRELQEISCQKKDKSKTKMTESSVRNSTKLELKSSLVNRIKEKENKIKQSQTPMDYFESISKDFGSPSFNSMLLKSTINEHIISDQESDSQPQTIIASIENIEALQSSADENDTGRITCIVKNPQTDFENVSEITTDIKRYQESEEEAEKRYICEFDTDKMGRYEIDISYSIGDRIQRIQLNPGMKFTTEERQRVDHLLKLDQSIVIRFDDLEHDVAVKVIHEMFDKAFSFLTMDYELIFWGYTFAIKKITWFAQAIDEFSVCEIEDKKTLLLQNLDPMFNIKSAMFFLSQSDNLFEQLRNFCVFDTKHLISAENALSAPPMKWNQFFRTPWANNLEHEKKYEILLDQAKELELDERAGCLLQVVALFANDGTVLKTKEQVERLQENFCILLFRFLIDRDGEEAAAEKFPKYISMLSHLREMADIMRNQTLKL